MSRSSFHPSTAPFIESLLSTLAAYPQASPADVLGAVPNIITDALIKSVATTPGAGGPPVIPTSFQNPVLVLVPDQKFVWGPGNVPPKPAASQRYACDAYYYIPAADTASVEVVSNDALAPGAITCKAKFWIRGNSTRMALKPALSFSLTSDPSDGQPFMHMSTADKKWVLNDCGVIDATRMRNKFCFDMQRALGQWAPESKYFELLVCPPGTKVDSGMQATLQSSYLGIYICMDKIEIGSARIPVPKFKGLDKDPSGATLTPGFVALLNDPIDSSKNEYLIPLKDGTQPQAIDHTGMALALAYPEKSDLAKYENALQVIRDDFFTGTYPNPEGGIVASGGWAGNACISYNGSPNMDPAWQKFVADTDLESFAVYLLCSEFAQDQDGYHKNTFFYRTPDTVANGQVVKGKYFAGPLWDHNLSYGNTAIPNYKNPAAGWAIDMDGGNGAWYHALLQHKEFQQVVMDAWRKYSPNVLSKATLQANIESMRQYVLSRNGMLERDLFLDYAGVNSTEKFNAACASFSQWIGNRFDFISANIATLCKLAQ